jgi:hypothetical protein
VQQLLADPWGKFRRIEGVLADFFSGSIVNGQARHGS